MSGQIEGLLMIKLASYFLALLGMFIVPTAASHDVPLNGDQILALAREAAGGDGWAHASSLELSGTAIFYGNAGSIPRSRSDNYRMWRVFDRNRKSAHGPDGKVRIIAKSGSKVLFEVGFDGKITWTDKGIVPKAEADKYWSNSFGFGIVRQAGKPGFVATRLPDDNVDGHSVYMVELTDSEGGKTLFGVDQQTHAIRKVGFRTPRGWHERTYDDFVELKNPRWLQAQHVTLYYDGRKSNEVFWHEIKVNKPIGESVFRVPAFDPAR